MNHPNTLILPSENIGTTPLWRRFIAYFRNCPRTYLYIAFLIPALMTFLVYAFVQTYPFGQTSVLVLDLNAQYIYFFDALRDAFYGDGSLLYSFRRAMGGEFMGIYAYYLASPLSYLVCLFPRENMPEAIWFLLCVKSGLCGMCFAYFARHTAKCGKAAAIVFGAMYAFSGYALALQSNTMWVDGIYWLPLIAEGVQRLVKEKKVILYTLSLAMTLLCNYYIGYMTCFFVFFYFFASYFATDRAERNPNGEKAHFIKALLRIFVFSVTGFLISCAIIAPAYYSLTFGKDTFTSPTFSFTSLYPLLNVFGKLLFASYDTISPDGTPFLYSGILTLFLTPLYFLAKKITSREKIAYGVLLLVFLFISVTKATDLVMHGFQAPNWMNCRYAFFFSFLLLFLAARYLSLEDRIPPLRKTVSLTAVWLIFVVCYFVISDKNTNIYLACGLSLLLFLIYGISLVGMKLLPNKKRIISAVTVAVIGLELLASGLLTLFYLDEDVVISWRRNYANYGDRFTDISEYVDDADTSYFYRAERTVARKMNDNYQVRLNGLSGSTSTLNRSQIDFLSVIGINSRSHFSQYDFANPVVDMLMGIKYIFAAPDQPLSEPYILRYVKCAGVCITLGDVFQIETRVNEETAENEFWLIGNGGEYRLQTATDVLVYENPLALSLGYTVSEDALGITFVQPEIDENGEYITDGDAEYISVNTGDTRNACERLNIIASALLGEDVTLFKEIRHTTKTENVTSMTTYRTYEKINEESGKRKTERFQSTYYRPDNSEETACVTFTFRGTAGKHVYMYIPCASYDETSFTFNGVDMGNYFGTYNYGILDLGECPGTNTVTFTVKKDGLHVGKDVPYFYTLDEDALYTLYAKLSANDAVMTSFTSDSMRFAVTATEEMSRFLLTIPYDEGWSITVDGVAVTPERVLDACLSVSLTPGTHEISMYYFPKIYRYGIILSAVGILSLSVFGILPSWIRKKKKTASRIEAAE